MVKTIHKGLLLVYNIVFCDIFKGTDGCNMRTKTNNNTQDDMYNGK